MENWTPTVLKEKLESHEGVLFLKLWKTGCGPCKLSAPAVERLEKKYSEVTFAQINAADHPEMLDIAGTDVLPVFFLFKSGVKLGQQEGFKGLKRLDDFVAEAVSPKDVK